ncbi:MAG: glycosyltransferase family 4 protein [Nitrospirales bacterium]|nr:glycosyltransferase family 4 protein [Nitrospirales bacterium]
MKERMVAVSQLPGYEVQVVAPVPYWPPINLTHRQQFRKVVTKETIEGITVHHPRYLMIPKMGMSLHGWLMYKTVLTYVQRLEKSYPFDVIDAHYVYPDGYAGVLLGAHFRRPVVVSARGSDVNQFASFYCIRKFLSYTLRHASHAIAVCDALKQAMIPLGSRQDATTVIPNGVDPHKFFPMPQDEARRQLDLPSRKIILSVGGLIPRKGFDLLIKSFRQVTEKKKEKLLLVIVGEGPERVPLQQLVTRMQLNDQVRFGGDIAHSDLYRWYSAADLFCLASSREGWPNVVLEAMACGTPVVATSIWGTPEIISSPTVGLLTERNEDALAKTLEEGLLKSWDRERIVQFAREHDWGHVAQSCAEVFQSVHA